jgi:hypothetical protein
MIVIVLSKTICGKWGKGSLPLRSTIRNSIRIVQRPIATFEPLKKLKVDVPAFGNQEERSTLKKR